MKRFLYRMTAFLVSVTLLLQIGPVSSFAAEPSAESVSQASSNKDPGVPSQRIIELSDRREENVRHFRQDDGSSTAVLFTSPVHYRDADGAWAEIDNTLTENGGSLQTRNGKELRQLAGNLREDTKLLTIQNDSYSLSMTPSEISVRQQG